jgi:hypothetical protein
MASPRCAKVRELLSAHLDGVLDPHTRLFIDEHLSSCASCAAEAESLKATVAIARTVPRLALPKEFHAALVQRARAEAVTVAAQARHHRSARAPGLAAGFGALMSGIGGSFRRKPWQAIAATAAALVLVVWTGAFASFMGVNVPGFHLLGLDKSDQQTLIGSADDRGTGSLPGSEGTGNTTGSKSPDMALGVGGAGGTTGSGSTDLGSLTQGAAGRQFILSVYLTIGCDKVSAAKDRAVATAEGAGGFMESLNYWTDANGLTVASLVLRVPATSLAPVLKELRGLGEVVTEQAARADVTAQHIDLTARVSNLRLQEQRLLALLGRAENLTDLFAIENELARVRTEIESYDSQLRALDEQISLSTVSLTLQPKGTGLFPEASLWQRIVEAFMRSLKWLGQLGGQIVILLATLVAPLALLALLGYGFYRLVQARRRRMGA